MKKIFTLLFCVVAIGLSASAEDNSLIDRCINVLLTGEQPTRAMATDMDANHDGVISIGDVTALIDQKLAANQGNRAPASEIDVNAMIDEVLKSQTGEPNIHDVNEAIEHNLKLEKK